MYIYLQTPPDSCFDRIAKRARAGEEALTLAGLKEIESAMAMHGLTAISVDARGPPNATIKHILERALEI